MIEFDQAVSERNIHRIKKAQGKFRPEHADFYAKRAAKHARTDPFTYNRVYSHLMSGFMVPHDIPRLSGDVRGEFDN